MEHLFLSLAFFISAMVASVRVVHMLQLSSYQWQGYLRWMKNDGDTVGKFAPAAVVAFLGLWDSVYTRYAAAALLAAWVIVMFPKKGAKKPFKLTARALRIFAVLALLLAGIAVAAFLTGGRYETVILGAGYAGVLLLVPLANLLLTPVQKSINRWYIRDAQKKLRPGLTVIGVTGSYGKTSVKTYIAQLLSVKYNVLATPESYNTPMGVVRTIREKLTPAHNIFVCEMGARHVGDIKEICDIVRPKHGVITAVGTQHLETFKSQENIANTKFELADALPENGTAFLAWGNEIIRTRAKDRANTVRYAVSEDSSLDVRAENLSADAEGLSFDVVTKAGERERFTTALLGRHNAENVTAAAAVALAMGVTLREMVSAARRLQPAKHRLELLPKGGGLTVIDDAYNANPAGAAAALDALSMFGGAKIIITPGMVELGESEEPENRKFGRNIAGVCDYAVLVGEKQTRPIAEGLRDANYAENKLKVFENFNDAYEWVLKLEEREKIVLIENDLPDNYK